MLFHGERRWLPSVHVVAGSALALVNPFGKLTIMRIGLVAIHALRKNQRLLEIAVRVALGAIHTGMFSFERKLRLRVVKTLIHRRDRNLLPARRAVAGLAALRKTPAMRIFVA